MKKAIVHLSHKSENLCGGYAGPWFSVRQYVKHGFYWDTENYELCVECGDILPVYMLGKDL